MRKPSLIALLAIAVSSGSASGQESAAPPDSPAVETPAADEAELDVSGMTLEELVEEAYRAIETAETRGPDAQAASTRANQLIAAIRRRDTLNSDAEFLGGRVQILMGHPREAIQAINNYTKSRKGENDWYAFNLLGDLYFQARYHTMARDKYQRAVDLNPLEAEPCAGLAQAESALARYHQSAEWARKAIELDAQNPPAERDPKFSAVLANALMADRQLDEALKAATAALELGRLRAKDDPTKTVLLTDLKRFNGLVQKVLQHILISFPERTDEYVRITHLQLENAEIDHLLRLHRVLQMVEYGIAQSEPNPSPALLFEKAKLLLAVGNTEEAVQVLTDLLAKNPNHAEAQRLLVQTRGPESAAPTAP